MGIFDGLVDSLSRTASTTIASGQAKLSELTTAVTSRLGGVGSFQRVASGVPTIDEQLRQASRDALRRSEILEQNEYALANAYLEGRLGRTEAQAQATTLNTATEQTDQSHKVTLEQITVDQGSTAGGLTRVVFEVMPEITENRTVEYEPIAPPQFPGAFQKYKGTSSVQWTINATLISRTTEEATQNLAILNTLRGWTMPYFGTNTATRYPQALGAPPPVLRLSGFRTRMVGPVPVVITSLNWNFPRDVDYLPTTYVDNGQPTPFPSVMQISILVVESFSTQEFNRFTLSDYRRGAFGDAFSRPTGEVGINLNEARAQSGLQGSAGSQPTQEAQTVVGATQSQVRAVDNAIAARSFATQSQVRAVDNAIAARTISEEQFSAYSDDRVGSYGGGGEFDDPRTEPGN